MPHYVDSLKPHIARTCRQPGVRLLDVHDEPLKLLHDMAECETIITMSLHGLVFAEGLGIPNLWETASGDILRLQLQVRGLVLDHSLPPAGTRSAGYCDHGSRPDPPRTTARKAYR